MRTGAIAIVLAIGAASFDWTWMFWLALAAACIGWFID